jgi:hypothetical protein
VHKIKDGKALSRSHNNLNTIDDNTGLTKSLSASTELRNVHGNLKFLFLKFLLID